MPAAGWRLLRVELRPARADLVRLAFGSVLAGAPALVSGLAVSHALDDGFLAGDPATGVGWLGGFALLGVAGAYLTQALLPVMARVVEPLRDRLTARVVAAGLDRVIREESGRNGVGTVAVQATEHVENARRLVVALLRTAFSTVTTMVLAIAGLATLVPLVALAVLPFLLVGGAAWWAVLRRLVRRQRRLLLAWEDLGESSRALLAARRDIEAYGAGERALRPTLADIGSVTSAAAGVNRLGWLRTVLPALSVHTPVLLLLLLAPWLTQNLRLSPGDLIGGVVYLVHGLTPAVGFLVSGGAGLLVQLGLTGERIAAATAVAPVHAAGGEAPTDLTPRAPLTPQAPLDLGATGLTFAYSRRATPVLAGVDLTVPAGTHLAVVGPSGAGKSTLAALLTGERRPAAGQVTIAGTDPARWPPELIWQTIAVVPQESYVFAGSVRENLAYLRPAATDGELDEASARFGLTGTVARLGGLGGVVPPGGAGLAAGERQRLALARAWLSPASIVLLDEATCHLDPEAEEVVETEMRLRGGTLIVIAHRISSALRADLVALVVEGRVRLDTHDRLLRRDDRYAELVDHWYRA